MAQSEDLTAEFKGSAQFNADGGSANSSSGDGYESDEALSIVDSEQEQIDSDNRDIYVLSYGETPLMEISLAEGEMLSEDDIMKILEGLIARTNEQNEQEEGVQQDQETGVDGSLLKQDHHEFLAKRSADTGNYAWVPSTLQQIAGEVDLEDDEAPEEGMPKTWRLELGGRNIAVGEIDYMLLEELHERQVLHDTYAEELTLERAQQKSEVQEEIARGANELAEALFGNYPLAQENFISSVRGIQGLEMAVHDWGLGQDIAVPMVSDGLSHSPTGPRLA